jgi:flagellum-specific peptidoglycan hydrolase FlgJ
VLRRLCTPTAFRFRLVPALLAERIHLGRRRSPQPLARPMALSAEWAGPAHGRQLAAVGLLALVATSLWQQESVVSRTPVASDRLRDPRIVTVRLDAADRPATDPSLSTILDPRPASASASEGRQQRSPVQPFEYEVPERVVRLVQVGQTLKTIAERYVSRLDDIVGANIVGANTVASPDSIVPGQAVVMAGELVAMPTLPTESNPASVDQVTIEAVTPVAPTPVAPTAVPTAEAPPAPTEVSRPPTESSPAEALPLPPGAARWQREFILAIAPGARESQRKTGVPASVTLAQAILESDWGRSKLTREANNLFGIKALNGPGSAGTYEIDTEEVDDGEIVTVPAAFKAYTSLAESIVDHGRWFHENSRYRNALKVRDDPRAFAYAINDAGYATDPAYAPKLIGLIDRFKLDAYDVQPAT